MSRFLKNLACVSLLIASTSSFAQAQDAKKVTVSPQERARIEQVVREYLLQKPEIIVEAVQQLQKKQYEQQEKTLKDTQASVGKFGSDLFNHSNDPVVGNPNGTVTVVEFFDYQCPHCIDMAPTIAAVLKANSDLRIVFKDFPIRGPISEFAARAALAANKQGKYYEVSHAILTTQPPLTEANILDAAKKTGVDVDKLKKDMNDPAITQQLTDNNKLAQQLKLLGTPAFFIGKSDKSGTIVYVPGQMNQNQMQDAIDKAKSS